MPPPSTQGNDEADHPLTTLVASSPVSPRTNFFSKVPIRENSAASSNRAKVLQVVCEVGSGLNGKRPKLRRVLSDPDARVLVVEHRDRLARFGVEHLEVALSAQGRRIVVADPGETTDDLVRDMIEVLTSMCARLYGRRGARNRAMRALTAAKREPGAAA
jgi:putative resolvase